LMRNLFEISEVIYTIVPAKNIQKQQPLVLNRALISITRQQTG
jgi:hypothetical protein